MPHGGLSTPATGKDLSMYGFEIHSYKHVMSYIDG